MQLGCKHLLGATRRQSAGMQPLPNSESTTQVLSNDGFTAVSNERGSDREEIERLTPKKLARSRNSTSYNESNPEDENARGETNEHAGEVDKQEEEDGEELEEEM